MHVITVSENGYVTMTNLENFRVQTRGGRGLMSMKTSDRNGAVAAVAITNKDSVGVFITTTLGMSISIPLSQLKISGRNTQGCKAITLAEKDYVQAVNVY